MQDLYCKELIFLSAPFRYKTLPFIESIHESNFEHVVLLNESMLGVLLKLPKLIILCKT